MGEGGSSFVEPAQKNKNATKRGKKAEKEEFIPTEGTKHLEGKNVTTGKR